MRRTIIGLDLEKEHSQISYYSERTGEPESVSIAENQDKYLIPTPDGLLTENGKEQTDEQRVYRTYRGQHPIGL